MPIGLAEFKARFGLQPIDTVSQEDRFKALLRKVEPKIKAGMKRGDQVALDAYAAMKLRVTDRHWGAAADVLEEVSNLPVDQKLAAQQRAELAAICQPALRGGELPKALAAMQANAEAAILDDRYDEAADLLDELRGLMVDFNQQAALFDERLKAARAWRLAIDAREAANELASADQQKARAEFGAQMSLFQQAVATGNFAQAQAPWGRLEVLTRQLLDKASDEAMKRAYEAKLIEGRLSIGRLEALLAHKEPLLAPFRAEIARLGNLLAAAHKDFAEGRFAPALIALTATVTDERLLYSALQQQYQAMQAAIPNLHLLYDALKKGNLPATLPPGIDLNALKTQFEEAGSESVMGDIAKALRWVEQYTPGFLALGRAVDSAPPPVSPQAAVYGRVVARKDLSAVRIALTAPDADLAALGRQPGAAPLIDAVVRDIGSRADTPAKRELVRKAMMARFGLSDVTGGEDGRGLSTKSLPRLYKVLGMLPEGHTGNDVVSSIERQKGQGTSRYNNGTRKIVLKAGETDKSGERFDLTTLHEVGHAVDNKFGFMATNGKARQFGGWRPESLESIKRVAGDELGFFRHFEAQQVPRGLLEKYLHLALTGSDPASLQAQFKLAQDPTQADPKALEKHPAVAHAEAGRQKAGDDSDRKRDLYFAARDLITEAGALRSLLLSIVEKVSYGLGAAEAIRLLLQRLQAGGANPSDAVWEEMAVHPAIDFASSVRMKAGSSGLWRQGDAGAQRCAVNGRVYQEAYTNDWVSYLLAARANKVSDYQFRHRMEWFAECYSLYFVGRLPPSHPLAVWLSTQKKAGPQAA